MATRHAPVDAPDDAWSRLPPVDSPGDAGSRLLCPADASSQRPLSDTAARVWSRLLTPHLEHALRASGLYSADEAKDHVAFFSTHVSQWLGPAPAVHDGGLSTAYPSALTADHTPVEMSYSWKGQAAGAVRYVADVIPPNGQLTRAASLTAARRVLKVLDELGHRAPSLPFTPLVLPEVWTAVTDQFSQLELDIHPASSSTCAACSPSSTFIGFDLGRRGARTKLYWLLPACLSATSLVALLDAILSHCLARGHLVGLPRFAAHWAKVRRHLSRHMHGTSALRPRMLSMDASHYPVPRIKIYSRCNLVPDASFDTVEAHLTLNGDIPLQPLSRDAYTALWTRVQHNFHRQRAVSTVSTASTASAGSAAIDDPNPQRYCMITYDLFPTAAATPSLASSDRPANPDSCMTSKLYLFCDQMPGHDGFVARELLADSPAPALFFHREFEAGRLLDQSMHIKEIGLTARDGLVDIAAYISPAIFSTYSVAKDGS